MSVRIGLVGDTHIPSAGDDLPAEAYAVLTGCDRILHCGDLHILEVVDRLDRIAPTLVSRGNGDDPKLRPPGVPDDPRIADNVLIDVEGLSIGLTHDLELAESRPADEVPAFLMRRFGRRVDVAVSGHSHVPLIWGLADGTTLVNPGSPTLPYGYRGLVGTLGVLDVDDDRFEVTILDLATDEPQLHLVGPAPYPLTRGPRPVGGH
ncbi:MAG TPA: metallophosphoesterase family protein [Acidimicrobiia bacterium]|nr:metallophosphoesterase family protein [Acidimicrobiia bacterium]